MYTRRDIFYFLGTDYCCGKISFWLSFVYLFISFFFFLFLFCCCCCRRHFVKEYISWGVDINSTVRSSWRFNLMKLINQGSNWIKASQRYFIILLGMFMQRRRRRKEAMRLPYHATDNTGAEGALESSCLSDAGLLVLSVGFPNLEKLS